MTQRHHAKAPAPKGPGPLKEKQFLHSPTQGITRPLEEPSSPSRHPFDIARWGAVPDAPLTGEATLGGQTLERPHGHATSIL